MTAQKYTTLHKLPSSRVHSLSNGIHGLFISVNNLFN